MEKEKALKIVLDFVERYNKQDKELEVAEAMEFLKSSKANNETYWALIKIYNEHKSMFQSFSNEVDFASFIDNHLQTLTTPKGE